MNNRLNLEIQSAKSRLNAKHTGEKVLSVLAFVTALGIASPASADVISYDLAAGEGCAFPLHIDQEGSQPVHREFKDKNGKVVRLLAAGKGVNNTFTNVDNGSVLTLKPSGGSVLHTTVNPDGSTTNVATGYYSLVLFPTDIPAGPSTTLYVGRLVFTVSKVGVFTLLGSSGKQTDICAALTSPTP
ncbi:hypothetical protein AWB81_08041 [Caballeronia arationis]|uniref:hypothetical protein n=1 Tax=Caballeronia arationis TaxID=1777142 RepID=UPI00074B7318|nr:hypothetical protein [Caballeronia arationis]SAL07363.1 hypothetical protein AWB81_08041 [Caballeronia arationis]